MNVEDRSVMGQPDFEMSHYQDMRPAVQPTAAQRDRRKRLRRFNRWTIYVPVGAVALAWVTFIVALLWLAVVGEWFAMDTDQARVRALASGVADVFTMLMLMPVMLLCAVPAVGFVALLVARRRRSHEASDDQPSLPVFWKIENMINSVYETVARQMPRLANPVIQAHANAAFAKRIMTILKRTLRQETTQYDDEW